ncbi:hypothetical protein EW145_g3195 [Phellinidium pouzarii]|uniref:T6SS Phospholipase effector Tle1-like catalytic domain-containing protein n=1 Tax=Phellinidium pouzarii TaxID=167371 RepID=A0A4S4L7Y3_9AGAM|nr:hypothetical protein EW145_g3195 [Phellinidium pouzarii]
MQDSKFIDKQLPPAYETTPPVGEEKPSRFGRTLVLCCDGTGIGQVLAKKEKSTISSRISNYLERMFASTLEDHVKEGYGFGMNLYEENSKICLFRFSRGAYIVRVLAAMINKVGLLPEGNVNQFHQAYSVYIYINSDAKVIEDFVSGTSLQMCLKEAAVSSCLLPMTTSNPSIEIFRHALALDERRAKFKPLSYMTTGIKKLARSDVGGGSVPNGTASLARIPLRWMIRECYRAGVGILFEEERLAKIGLDLTTLSPNVLLPFEVEVHNDSEGNIRNGEMVGMAEKHKEKYDTDCSDAQKDIHDQLVSQKLWWAVECLPLREKNSEDSNVKDKVIINFGRSRVIKPDKPLFIHRSVELRMQHSAKYTPRLRYNQERVLVN